MPGQMCCMQKCGARMVRRQFMSVCFLVLNDITNQMVPRGFEVKAPGKEKCSHLGSQSTRPKVK